MHGLQYLFWGLEGHGNLVPLMRLASVLAILAAIILVIPATRRNEGLLGFACACVFFALWAEKGIGLIIAGFVPSPLEKVVEYHVTPPEIAITIGVWAMGFFVLTVLYKIALGIKEEAAA
jgi:molybdopterin-containing oxidoreductase family membrane subunit